MKSIFIYFLSRESLLDIQSFTLTLAEPYELCKIRCRSPLRPWVSGVPRRGSCAVTLGPALLPYRVILDPTPSWCKGSRWLCKEGTPHRSRALIPCLTCQTMECFNPLAKHAPVGSHILNFCLTPYLQ